MVLQKTAGSRHNWVFLLLFWSSRGKIRSNSSPIRLTDFSGSTYLGKFYRFYGASLCNIRTVMNTGPLPVRSSFRNTGCKEPTEYHNLTHTMRPLYSHAPRKKESDSQIAMYFVRKEATANKVFFHYYY